MTSRAPVYLGHEYLHPVNELCRGRFGSGILVVYDARKCDYVIAKRVPMREQEAFERQVAIHIRASSHMSVIGFLGLLPSSTTCFQYALEYVMDGNLRQLVVNDVGLPDEACKCIIRQLHRCLTYLHEELGIVHGDFRPEHILMSSVSRCIVKVCNFAKSRPIGSRVKMNTSGAARPMTWKNQIRKFKSFLLHRTSSLKLTPSGRRRESCDLEEKSEYEMQKAASRRPRHFSVVSSHPVLSKAARDTDVHEYTVDDFKKEINSEMFSQAFTAPELVNATRYVASPASDNWSLIILAIYCVTGNTPWETAAVDNLKYTAFLHSSMRSKSLTPQLNERSKSADRPRFSKFRSSSLSSLMVSIKRKTPQERKMSAAFERIMIGILKRSADQRVTLQLDEDLFSRKPWSNDAHKWQHYKDSFFNEEWINNSY